MRTELPVCKRCCFCLPLRYSLLTWGYIRLGLSTYVFTRLSMVFYWMLEKVITEENVPLDITRTTILASALLLLITDIVLNTVFIKGGYKKDMKLLRAYYIYSFILCILIFLLWIASIKATLFQFKIGEIEPTFHIYIILVDTVTLLALVRRNANCYDPYILFLFINCYDSYILFLFIDIHTFGSGRVHNMFPEVAQIFVLLLVRSEIIKLRSHCEFRFVNNTAETECTLECEELNGERPE